MRISLQTASLRETTVLEYVERFVFGGLITVAATLVADKWGPVIGGLFLAFPGIFPAGVCLVEKHKRKREADAGKDGTIAARREASVEATGASAGALGLIAFAVMLWKGIPTHALIAVLGAAALAWLLVSCLCWWLREKL